MDLKDYLDVIREENKRASPGIRTPYPVAMPNDLSRHIQNMIKECKNKIKDFYDVTQCICTDISQAPALSVFRI
jgi:hypothetical protein